MISAGEENPYGHPSPALLERLQQAGIPVLRADQNGDIHVATGGNHIEVNCFVACPQATALANLRKPEAPNEEEHKE